MSKDRPTSHPHEEDQTLWEDLYLWEGIQASKFDQYNIPASETENLIRLGYF